MALLLVPEPLTEESLAAAQYSCPVQVVPDQLWSVCSPSSSGLAYLLGRSQRATTHQ
jgi:hypothetical protein